ERAPVARRHVEVEAQPEEQQVREDGEDDVDQDERVVAPDAARRTGQPRSETPSRARIFHRHLATRFRSAPPAPRSPPHHRIHPTGGPTLCPRYRLVTAT